MTNMDIGDVIHLSEIQLPEGVRLTHAIEDAAHDHPVVTVQEPQKLDLGEEPEVEEGVEGELAVAEGEAGEEGAESKGGDDAAEGEKDES